MTNEDLIMGLKEQQVKSLARAHRLLEKATKAEGQDVADVLDAVRAEQMTTDQIVYQLQLLGGA